MLLHEFCNVTSSLLLALRHGDDDDDEDLPVVPLCFACMCFICIPHCVHVKSMYLKTNSKGKSERLNK